MSEQLVQLFRDTTGLAKLIGQDPAFLAAVSQFDVKRVMPFGEVIRLGDLVVDGKAQGKANRTFD